MSCDFTFGHYEECVERLKNKVWPELPIWAGFTLRHDVDSHLENAINFAKIENKLDIQAVYYIRLHGSYNPLSYPSTKIIKSIMDLGHKVGLHFEPEYYHLVNGSCYTHDLLNGIDFLYKNELTNWPFFTTHDIENLKKKNLYNSWGEDLSCRDNVKGKYISDSGGRWREGCMCQWIDKCDSLRINTHPTWWFEKSSLENF